ncbi:MAG: FAD-dependent oxidoreductase [Patescibacteria group bacterium]
MLDLVIIGGSSAATPAAIYAARRGLKFKIVTKDFGGELATSGEIGNWPGIVSTSGISLAQQFREHLEALHVEIEEGVEIEKIIKQTDGTFLITAKEPAGASYEAKTVIVATGAHPKELNIPGEKEYRTKGVSYCTVCDGPIFAGKVTATIGGGNSALESALMLADICSKVYVINKNAQFKGEQVLIDNLKAKKNVEIILNAKTTEIFGAEFAQGFRYDDTRGAIHELRADGIFVHIGMIPNSFIVPDEVAKDQFGYIKVNANCETTVPGLFAAGDVTDVPFKQNPIAAGQGTIALLSAVGYLNRISQ